MVTYKGEETASSPKREKVRENKTMLAPKPTKSLPELPELSLPELKPEGKEKKNVLLGLFRFGSKKETKRDEPILAHPEEIMKGTLPASLSEEEPEVLKEIDLDHHKKKIEAELALWLNDGRTITSLDELRKALKTISNRTFKQHHDRNDIAEWIRDIVNKPELAEKVAKAQNRKEAIKILEQDRKSQQAPEKKKDELLLDAPASSSEKLLPEPHAEIQSAIQEVTEPAKPRQKTTIETREKEIAEQENMLDQEEEHLNRKRIELANRRYALIKMRGELEKEKFESLLSSHKKAVEHFEKEDETAMPELTLTDHYSKEKLEKLIEDARSGLASGDLHAAEDIKKEIRAALETTALSPEEQKRIEYEVLELEADIKLAALV